MGLRLMDTQETKIVCPHCGVEMSDQEQVELLPDAEFGRASTVGVECAACDHDYEVVLTLSVQVKQ